MDEPNALQPGLRRLPRQPGLGLHPARRRPGRVHRRRTLLSSNEAGLGTWNPQARSSEGRLVDHVEQPIRRAIDDYGARYFKFDFLAWIDCADVDPVTAYDYRESFVAMLDRLIATTRT